MVGNVGDERCLEFTVIGDTVNVASRLERMTREKGVALAVSAELTEAARLQGGGHLLAGLHNEGEAEFRGRAGRMRVFTLPAAAT